MNVNWIKRKDRLPTQEDANIDEFIWFYCEYDGNKGVCHWANFKNSDFTHWAIMEFPESPEKEIL